MARAPGGSVCMRTREKQTKRNFISGRNLLLLLLLMAIMLALEIIIIMTA